MAGDDQIKSWRDYRKLLPTVQLNDLLHRSDDSGWVETRELLAGMGWTDLHRLAVIMGDTRGSGGVYVLLPDETVARVSAESGWYETCSVQAFADWDVQYAEPLWDAVVWLQYLMTQMRDLSRALRRSDEPKWRALRTFLEGEGLGPSQGVVADLWPDQSEEVGEFVANDRRRFVFEIPYKDPRVSMWREDPPDWARYPQGYRAYSHACWLLDASEGKTSDWIFTRPYAWRDKIKPGWNPPFGRPTFGSAEDAARTGMRHDVVRVASVTPQGLNRVAVELEVDDDPSGQFPMTVTCERLPNGRWRPVVD